MNPLLLYFRRAKRELRNVASYLDLDPTGNHVVRRTDFSQCAKPVLLLHGFFASRRVLEVLERRLRRDGYCVFSIDLGGVMNAFNTRGIDESAEKVRDKVERLYARFPNMGPLSIIGHSKGGLIGRYYVKRLGGDRRTATLITLGSPHNGTPTAYLGVATLGTFSKSVWQMTPMSPFIRRLKIGAFPRNVHFVSIYSKADKASPFPSCILETNQPNLFNVEVPGVSHQDLLLKRVVYEILTAELAKGLEQAGPARKPAEVAHLGAGRQAGP